MSLVFDRKGRVLVAREDTHYFLVCSILIASSLSVLIVPWLTASWKSASRYNIYLNSSCHNPSALPALMDLRTLHQQADVNKLITRKFKQRPATQAEMRDCAAVIGREQLAKVGEPSADTPMAQRSASD